MLLIQKEDQSFCKCWRALQCTGLLRLPQLSLIYSRTMRWKERKCVVQLQKLFRTRNTAARTIRICKIEITKSELLRRSNFKRNLFFFLSFFFYQFIPKGFCQRLLFCYDKSLLWAGGLIRTLPTGYSGDQFLRFSRLTRPPQRSCCDCYIAHGLVLTFQG